MNDSNEALRVDRFLSHLHRGGKYGHWWTKNDNGMRSFWWPVGNPSPIPNGHTNVYFGVHPTNEIPTTNSSGKPKPPGAVRSQNAYIAAINCLFAEFDAKDYGGKDKALDHLFTLVPTPSVVIDSGGGYHCYWLLREAFVIFDETTRKRADRLQKAWVERMGGDGGAKDLARVLRVPGTYNYKDDYAPDFPRVKFERCEMRCVYSLDELEALVPKEEPRTAPRTYTSTDDTQRAAKALERLSPTRCDNYEGWTNVGMALSELGSDGLALWDNWSQGSSKYKAGECDAKWKSFTPGNGITLASLFHWANEDSPIPPTLGRREYWEQEPPPEGGEDYYVESPNLDPIAPKTKLQAWTVDSLFDTNFPEPRWAVPGLVPAGLTFLGGRPKIGKSWLALQIAIAVGTGGKALGHDTEKGKVLFLAFEDSPRRLKGRLLKQCCPRGADVTFVTNWKNLQSGGLEDIRGVVQRDGYTLVIIDTLARSLGRADQMDFGLMGEIIGGLQNLAIELDITILANDHHRKGSFLVEHDPIDDVINSTGKVAPVDTAIGLYRDKDGAKLMVRGRDLEDVNLSLKWDRETCCWQSLGNTDEVEKSTVRNAIKDAIEELDGLGQLPTTKAISDYTDKDAGLVSRELKTLVSYGIVIRGEKVGREVPYYLAGSPSLRVNDDD